MISITHARTHAHTHTHTHTHTKTCKPIKKPDEFDGVDLLDGTKSVTLIGFE